MAKKMKKTLLTIVIIVVVVLLLISLGIKMYGGYIVKAGIETAGSKVLQVDVRELYLTKVKRIYSEIIAFAVHAQSDLNLSEDQHHRVSELKLANRKMVEIIKDAREIKRNVSRYLKEGHKVMISEYDEFRKKMVKVLRVIREFQDEDGEDQTGKLTKLSKEALANIHAGNLEIDTLIREKKVTPEMASSLVNDHDNLNDMIENLIEVARLLYGKKDILMEPAGAHSEQV